MKKKSQCIAIHTIQTVPSCNPEGKSQAVILRANCPEHSGQMLPVQSLNCKWRRNHNALLFILFRLSRAVIPRANCPEQKILFGIWPWDFCSGKSLRKLRKLCFGRFGIICTFYTPKWWGEKNWNLPLEFPLGKIAQENCSGPLGNLLRMLRKQSQALRMLRNCLNFLHLEVMGSKKLKFALGITAWDLPSGFLLGKSLRKLSQALGTLRNCLNFLH